MVPEQLSEYMAEKLWEDIRKYGKLDEELSKYAYCGNILRAMQARMESRDREIIDKSSACGKPYFRILAVRIGREYHTDEDKTILRKWFAEESDIEIRMRLAFQILHRGGSMEEKLKLLDFFKSEKEHYISHMNYYFGGTENVFRSAGLIGKRLNDERFKGKLFLYLPYVGEMAGRELLPALRSLLSDLDPIVQSEAKVAIASIEQRSAPAHRSESDQAAGMENDV